MKEAKYLTIISNKKEIVLNVNTILYAIMKRNNVDIHVYGGKVYTVRMTLMELEEKLGEGFIMVHRSRLVSAMAIHEISDKIYLNNGETIEYVVRKKKTLRKELLEKQRDIIGSFAGDDIPKTEKEYGEYYKGLEHLPFAFTDIEMVFNEERHAVDWIFRYGNNALAELEKISLEQLIGNSFGSLFPDMDSKWLRNYERATLYGEKLEIIDYSSEIDTYLKVICFPTFPGHCGCILFDISELEFARNSDAEKALFLYFGRQPENQN
ncbi:MAG: LytTR family DNA-binding domain-containing protein [Eubacterium sp.]|nr:LytTR family DNA-binding domain-containing protein [Eubacterium sp.]